MTRIASRPTPASRPRRQQSYWQSAPDTTSVCTGDSCLKRRHRGPAVTDLQNLLRAQGSRIRADGLFGPRTQRALQRFQRRAGLPVSGEADAATLRALRGPTTDRPAAPRRDAARTVGSVDNTRAPRAAPPRRAEGAVPSPRRGVQRTPSAAEQPNVPAADKPDANPVDTPAVKPESSPTTKAADGKIRANMRPGTEERLPIEHDRQKTKKGCLRASIRMAHQVLHKKGERVSQGHYSDYRRVYKRRTEVAENGAFTIDKKRNAQMVNHINDQLDQGKPVIVGLSHRRDKNVKDHFVTIVGRGVDEQGRAYYRFLDPGVNKNRGGDHEANRFYQDESGALVRDYVKKDLRRKHGPHGLRKRYQVCHYVMTRPLRRRD